MQFTRTALDAGTDKAPPGQFWLVESRTEPPTRKRLNNENDIFLGDFIGATEQDCQNFALELQQHHNHVDQDIIVIVDARSARDETVLVQCFNRVGDGAEDLTFGDYGVLPAERNVWYSFRIAYRYAPQVTAALLETAPDVIYPIYYGP